MRILAVDDSMSIRELVRLVLKATDGVSVVETADSADSALNIMQTQSFDLLMIDWSMQPKCGAVLLKEIKAQACYEYLPVIILSADQDPDAKVLAKSLGATGWINKPFHPQRLQELVLSFSPNNKTI